jgi:SWI/SNF-related matrix-associated actin-dependent regulator 1 of chromatin subfamily A
VRIDAGYGRLYVRGDGLRALSAVPGCAWNDGRRCYELSLTLESLRAISTATRIAKRDVWNCCTPVVQAWAKTAGEQERIVVEMHRLLGEGFIRDDLPWHDNRTGTQAPAGTSPTYPNGSPQLDPAGHWLRRDPFQHQRVMATVGCMLDGAAYLCEMGTGKTRAAIEVMQEKLRDGTCKAFVVVCPARVMGVWQREIAAWSRTLRPVVLDGAVKLREKAIDEYGSGRIHPNGHVFIINFETIYKLETAFKRLARRFPTMMIVDEMHRIANPQALTTKACMGLAQVMRWRLGQTGTPVRGSGTDVWSQWYFVDLGLTFGANYVQFRREFFSENQWTHETIPRDGTLDEINRRLHLRGLRYRKEDCLDLPPKVYTVAEVDMTPSQARAYRAMAEELLVRIRAAGEADDEIRAANQLVMIMRLCQITSGFLPSAETQTVHRFEPNAKARALEETVRDAVASGRQALIWAWYKHDVDYLLTRFADFYPACIRGGQTIAQHGEAERRFQTGESPILIANQASGGTGLTLTKASLACYFSQHFSMIDRLQSEDRCHRAGSEIHEHVLYEDYVCRGTVDEIVRAAIAEKKDLARTIVELREHLEDAA